MPIRLDGLSDRVFSREDEPVPGLSLPKMSLSPFILIAILIPAGIIIAILIGKRLGPRPRLAGLLSIGFMIVPLVSAVAAWPNRTMVILNAFLAAGFLVQGIVLYRRGGRGGGGDPPSP